jgi:tRNA nucleotidyltransferase (CCA-adding enzyme)
MDEIIEQQQCFSLKDLAVNGRDLIDAGVPQGTKIGIILNKLMDMVIDDEAKNDKTVLLKIAKEII